MQFQIRTLQILIVLSVAPIWMLCEGEKVGCADRMMLVWGILVAAPLLLMWLVLSWVRKEHIRDRVIAFFGAIAIVGYVMAIPGSMAVIGISAPWRLP